VRPIWQRTVPAGIVDDCGYTWNIFIDLHRPTAVALLLVSYHEGRLTDATNEVTQLFRDDSSRT
jgi:hypothetical protein